MSLRTLLAALGTILGLQTLRALFPLLVYVLKDRVGLPSTTLGAIGVLVFATAFAMPALAARAGAAALPRMALALAAARTGLQVWPGDPAISLALAGVGTVTFLAFLAAVARKETEGEHAVLGFVAGALGDTVIFALFGTRDLAWGGPWADPAAAVLLVVTVSVAWHLHRQAGLEAGETIAAAAPLGLLAWGPFLCLHLELLGNVARLSARSGYETAASGTLAGLGLAAAALVAVAVPRRGAAGVVSGALGAAALAGGLLGADRAGPLAFPTLVLAQTGAIALLVRALTPCEPPRGSAAAAAAHGAGWVLFLALLFAHYAGYDLPLPVDRTQAWLAAGALLAAAALAPRDLRPEEPPSGAWALPAVLVAFVPLARPELFPAAPAPDESARPGETRAVTLNLHAGFDERGGWSFDREMQSLRAARPDVVALQEVSRGWVINGSADLYELARESLGLHGVPGPSVRSDWGNAVFSRTRPGASSTIALPPRALPIPRAVTSVDVPLEDGSALRVLATHLHHVQADSTVRELQATFLAALPKVTGAGGSLLLGDFNALPGSRCLSILREAGWTDVHGPEAGSGETFPASDPVRRIDTVLHRGGLRLSAARVAEDWGSDHRAVIADFSTEPRRGE
jgi:endonuclease/exonuclease/phosphatase family metal-dependent hydrolase